MKQILGTIVLAILLSISGCGGGGSSSGAIPAASGTVISGVVAKGLFNSGAVTCYFVTNGITSAPQVAVNIGSDGSYSLNIGTYTGVVLLVVNSGRYINEANNTAVSLTTQLRTALVVTSPGSYRTACITPLTELAVRKAAALGGLSSTNVNAANALLSDIFPFDILVTRPVPPLAFYLGSATSDQQCYTLLLAGISKYGVSTFLNDYAADLATPDYRISSLHYTALNTATQNFLSDNLHNFTGYDTIAEIPKFNTVGWYTTLVAVTATKQGSSSLDYANVVQFSLKLNTHGEDKFSIDEDPAFPGIPDSSVVTLSRYDSLSTFPTTGITTDDSVPALPVLKVGILYQHGITPGRIATIRLKTKPGSTPGPLDITRYQIFDNHVPSTAPFASLDDNNTTDSLWDIEWAYIQP